MNHLARKLFPVILALCAALPAGAGGKRDAKAAPVPPYTADADTSYALGLTAGEDILRAGIRIDYGAYLEGLKDVLENKPRRFDDREAPQMIAAAIAEARTALAAGNRAAAETFLAANGKRSGVVTTRSGLQYEVIAAGKGARPGSNDTVQVRYEGAFLDGAVFESSLDAPARFRVREAIPGWVEALQLMSPGAVYRLYLPPDLAYGESGGGETIPPNAALVYRLELVSIGR